jgi:hypothetical protein
VNKKRILIIVGAVVAAVAILALIGLVSYPKPETVFRNHLEKLAKTNVFANEESYSGTGTVVNVQGKVDLSQKNLMVLGNMSCNATISGSSVKMDFAVQQENASSLVKINDVTGTINSGGVQVDLSPIFSKVKGNWYKLDSSQDSASAKAQLDGGVYVFEDGIMAPGHDAKSVAQTLLDKKVFTIKSSSRSGSTYKYTVEVSKSAYSEAIKSLFPNLSNQDKILDSVFEGESTVSMDLSLGRDGSFKSETRNFSNSCASFVNSFTGASATNFDKKIKGQIVEKKLSDVSIRKIENSKPFTQYVTDISGK